MQSGDCDSPPWSHRVRFDGIHGLLRQQRRRLLSAKRDKVACRPSLDIVEKSIHCCRLRASDQLQLCSGSGHQDFNSEWVEPANCRRSPLHLIRWLAATCSWDDFVRQTLICSAQRGGVEIRVRCRTTLSLRQHEHRGESIRFAQRVAGRLR